MPEKYSLWKRRQTDSHGCTNTRSVETNDEGKVRDVSQKKQKHVKGAWGGEFGKHECTGCRSVKKVRGNG